MLGRYRRHTIPSRSILGPEDCSVKLICYYFNDLLTGHFGIEKTQKLVAKKYFWSIFYRNVEVYVKGYDVNLASKVVHHELYRDLQSLLVPINCWKDLFVDIVTSLPLLVYGKYNSYDAILVVFYCLTQMVSYELVKTTIDIVS